MARFFSSAFTATALLSVGALSAFASIPAPTPRVGDYRTRASGTFADPTIWETLVAGPSGTAADGTFQPAAASPTAADGTITIRAGHTVSASEALTVDELFVESDAVLEHSGSSDLVLNDGATAYDMVVQGTYRELSAGSRLAASLGAAIMIDNGGTLRHSADGGFIPVATWSTTSTLQFDGIKSATTLAGRLGQEFGRITWNCPQQLSTFAFGPVATESNAVTTVAANDFTVVSTGAGRLQLTSATKTNPIVFNANYRQLGGNVFVSHSALTVRTLNVAGDFIQQGGSFTVTNSGASSAAGQLSITGSFQLLGGAFDIARSNSPGSVSVIGDVRVSANATMGSPGSGTATFNFASGPMSHFTNQGTISGAILFNVNGGATIDFDENTLTGNGTFTLSDGSIGMFASADGISSVGAADQDRGNIRVGNVTQFQRTYSPLAYFMYTGQGAQVTGSGLPQEIGTASATLNAGGLGIYNTSSAGTVTLSRPVRISGELILGHGYLVSAPATKLTLSASAFMDAATAGSATSYVQGVMARDMDNSASAYSYPVGDGAYRPISMRLLDNQAVTYDVAARRDTPPTGSQPTATSSAIISLVGDAYWAVSRTVGSTNAIARLAYDPATSGDPATLTVVGYNPTTNQWADMGTVARSAAATWLETQLAPQYSLVMVGRAAAVGPLPVELLRFSARRQGSVVALAWQTASERNSDYFAVERSADGRSFAEISRQQAAGNSATQLDYASRDERPLTGTAYYRLRQVDRDGTTSYSKVVSVTGNASGAVASFYPNPATDRLTVDWGQLTEVGAVRIVSPTGQQVLQQTLSNATATVDLSWLPNGTYLVTLSAPGQPDVTQRLLKTNQ